MEAPAALKRIGLTQVDDNLQPGDQFVLKGSLVMAFFGDELLRALHERQGKQSGRSGSKGRL